MIIKLISALKSPKAIALVATLALLTFLGPVVSAAEQQASDRDREASSSPLSRLSAGQYPSVRALVLARGNCVVFEYYRKDIGIETQSPVYSVTKSVLSILVGIAIDEGFLRLDEKLSEIFPEEFDENVDPLARDITVRDLLTKTEGFEEGGWGHFKVGAGASGKSQVWRWMLNRRVKYPRGAHFRYDGIGSDLLSVVLSACDKAECRGLCEAKAFRSSAYRQLHMVFGHGRIFAWRIRSPFDRARYGEDRHSISSAWPMGWCAGRVRCIRAGLHLQAQ